MTLTYTYDHLHRRVRKLLEGPGIVERPAADIGGEEEEGLGEPQLDGVAGVGPYPAAGYDRRFVYDGWNLQAEYDWVDGSLSEIRTYAWGLDLSGSLHGAGGVGGLLFTAPVGTYPGAVSAALHDGNGNVTGLRMGLDPADFSYGPFGEPVADDGPTCTPCPAGGDHDLTPPVYLVEQRMWEPFYKGTGTACGDCGLLRNAFRGVGANEPDTAGNCPAGSYKIALTQRWVDNPNPIDRGCMFHIHRQEPDGRWTDKDGRGCQSEPYLDPFYEFLYRWFTQPGAYSGWCGYMCWPYDRRMPG